MNSAVADLADVIGRALRLSESDMRSRLIHVVLDVPPGLPPVRVNTERLTQALLNLFLNAAQAMGEGGELRVGARLCSGGQTFCITVADNGPGIARDIQAPFIRPILRPSPSAQALALHCTRVR